MENLGQFLAWRKALANVLAHRTLTYSLNERLDDWQSNIGLQQSKPYLSQGILDIAVGESALAG
jgi:hypothetical protein